MPCYIPSTDRSRSARSIRSARSANRLVLALSLIGIGACATARPEAATPAKTLSLYRQALVRDDAKAAYALLARPIQQSLPYEQFVQQWQETKEERATQAAELDRVLGSGKPGIRSIAGDGGQPAASARAVVTLPQGAQLVLLPVGESVAAAGKPAGKAAGPALALTTRAQAWRIVDPDLQTIHAPTPEAALRLLIAAAEQRSYPALLRLLSRSERQSLEAELAERIERLRASLARGQAGSAAGGSGPASATPTPTPTPSPSPAAPLPPWVPEPGTDSDPGSNSDRVRIQYDPRFFIELRREEAGWRIADFN
jgi:hypothetical protein